MGGPTRVMDLGVIHIYVHYLVGLLQKFGDQSGGWSCGDWMGCKVGYGIVLGLDKVGCWQQGCLGYNGGKIWRMLEISGARDIQGCIILVVLIVLTVYPLVACDE
eukprot:2631061-Ditylum_brightwellii.AAC.1